MGAITRQFMLQRLDDTVGIAAALAASARPGDVIALSGEVGTGKTSFAQAFIHPLLKAPEPVTSPTFTLVQRYETKWSWQIVHADLYRVKHVAELAELGLEDAFEQYVMLVEWPHIAEHFLPDDRLNIHLDDQPQHGRTMTLHTHSERWKQAIAELIL